MTADHPTGTSAFWTDGDEFRFGFSTDPQVMPQSMNQMALNVCGFGNNLIASPRTTNPWCIYHTASFAIEPNDTGGIYHWYAEGTDTDATGPGVMMMGNVTLNRPTVTGLSSTAALVGGGAAINYGGTATIVIGSCLPGGTTYINTVNSDTQITLSQNANTTGSCSLTFKQTQISHEMGVARANNINGPWTLYGPTHPNYFQVDFSSFQRPLRLGNNNWTSYSFQFAVRAPERWKFDHPGRPQLCRRHLDRQR
jgi:hypothetical protein